MPRLLTYTAEYQQALENYFHTVRTGTAFPFEPEGAHADLRNISEIYQSKGGQFWLLLDGNILIGTVALKCLEPGGEVKRLQVLEDYQGRGFGKQLFAIALEHASEQGFSCVRLDSVRSNGPALHLYDKFGFREIDRYNDNPHADIFMELSLN